MELGSPEWETLMQAFAGTRMYGVVVGWVQRANDSLYMTQSLVGPFPNGSAGAIWNHQKFRPSSTERSLYSDGLLDTIRTQKLPFGTVSMLQCWEDSFSHDISSLLTPLSFGNDVPEANGDETPYLYWRAAAIGYAAGAAGFPATLLPAASAATIFSQQGSPLNESLDNSKESTDLVPFVTAVLNTTALYSKTSYSVNAWYSWGALESILGALPNDMPRHTGPFLQRVVITIQEFTSGFISTPTLSYTPTSKWPCIRIWPERVEADFMA
ncbi:hypothetical protein N0V90_012134 [Kalmusia sp. IMI 367209]|nr:hypothetical protein N0V90_012134 [Kalmusia sp. IMI 367209]